MVPTRVAELAAFLNGADRPTPVEAQHYAGLAGLLPESLSVPVGGDLDAVVELLHGIDKVEAHLATAPVPSPKHDLLREILSDRAGLVVTWSDAILAWRRWERVWHGVHTDPAGSGVADVADSLLWLGPGGSDAYQRLREMDLPGVQDGDVVVGYLADRRRGEAWFVGGRLGPRRLASVLAAAYGRTDRLRHRRVVAVGITPETPAEHAALFELSTGRLRQVLGEAGLDRRKRNVMCTIFDVGDEDGPGAKTWVEIVLSTGERFDLELPAGEEPLVPADYPVERSSDGRHALVCLDDVHRMYTLARGDLPGAVPEPTVTEPAEPEPEPEPTVTEPAVPDHADEQHTPANLEEATSHLAEITSLSRHIDERLKLLPVPTRQRFEVALASARAGIEELPRPDPQGSWGRLSQGQAAQLRRTRDELAAVSESIVHDILQPEVSERLFRETAQLLDAATNQRIEDVQQRIAHLDQPHRDTAAADYDRIRRTLAESLQALRREASAARGAGDFTPQDMRRIEHRAYRYTLDAHEQLGDLLENLRPEVVPVG